jgi:methyl-accepting chemotaxis protein
VDSIARGISEIRAAMSRLADEGKAVEAVLGRLIQGNDEVKASAAESERQVDSINGTVERIRAYSQDTRVGMEEVTIGVRGVWEAIQLVSETSRLNSETISRLRGLVERFKTEGAEPQASDGLSGPSD